MVEQHRDDSARVSARGAACVARSRSTRMRLCGRSGSATLWPRSMSAVRMPNSASLVSVTGGSLPSRSLGCPEAVGRLGLAAQAVDLVDQATDLVGGTR